MTQKNYFILMNDNTAWVLEANLGEELLLKLYRQIDWINGKDCVLSGEAVNNWIEQSGSDLEIIFPIENNSVHFNEDNMLEYSELLDDIQ